ncbi:MAG: hypothetical protein ABI042_01640 [Verrucomicrobiota bacterium]
MKTLSATKARQNLGEWIDRAVRGEDIGIIHSASGKIVALRPVEVYSEDYAWTEYGLTKGELDRSHKKVSAEIEKERKEGKLKLWKP